MIKKLALVLVAASPALALDIESFDPDANARFSSGFPTAPVANSDSCFLGAPFDLSGVGWVVREPTHAATLISPRHFVFANHNGVGIGDAIRFMNRDGVVREFTVAKAVETKLENGQNSDVGVATLSAEISPSEKIASYPVANLGDDVSDYLQRKLYLYGHGPNTHAFGTNEIVDLVIEKDKNPLITYLSKGRITGMAMGESGDSGSPTFIEHDGKLAVLGTHIKVDQDVLLAPFLDQIAAIVKADGQEITVVK